jgi:ATP-dependent Lon protease
MSELPVPAVPSENAIPVLPLRDVVVYPHMVIPLFVGREKSILALEAAMKGDKRIMLVAQRQAEVDDPKQDDLYKIGTLATILRRQGARGALALGGLAVRAIREAQQEGAA